ncbi:MAG: hypothetical protein ACD_79C00466G0016 [uncultured bacterium]|nr:MAG: hypothetical protein ACD_79C00466G0016 [uncultured bacterium]
MCKKIDIISTEIELFKECGQKLSDGGYSVHSFLLKEYILKDSFDCDLIVIDVVPPLKHYEVLLNRIHDTKSDIILFFLCDKDIVSQKIADITFLSKIHSIRKLFYKPVLAADIVDYVNLSFNPSSKSIKKVLVIDDSPTQLAVTIKNISPYYNVLTASTGKEGLLIGMSQIPDLILLDLNLPDVNGLKVCADFKSFKPTCKIPIIAFSYTEDPTLIDKTSLVGADDFFHKKNSDEELIKKIDKFLKSNYIAPKINYG